MPDEREKTLAEEIYDAHTAQMEDPRPKLRNGKPGWSRPEPEPTPPRMSQPAPRNTPDPLRYSEDILITPAPHVEPLDEPETGHESYDSTPPPKTPPKGWIRRLFRN